MTTLQDFISQVNGEITASCSIPFSLPPAEIERLVKLEKNWIQREYRDAVQGGWYVLDKMYYGTKEWKNTRTFQLPDCVMAIKYCIEMTSGQRVFGIHDPDLTFDRLMAADLYLSPLSSDQITYRTIQWSFWDLAKQFNLKDIQHSFNINTKRLIILGRDPSESLFISTLNKIPDEDLYDDPLFLKWIIARAKMQLARIIGTFNYTLLGGIQINYADIRSEGSTELEELKQKLHNDNQPDWFLLFN
jgi:hypothetical protein